MCHFSEVSNYIWRTTNELYVPVIVLNDLNDAFNFISYVITFPDCKAQHTITDPLSIFVVTFHGDPDFLSAVKTHCLSLRHRLRLNSHPCRGVVFLYPHNTEHSLLSSDWYSMSAHIKQNGEAATSNAIPHLSYVLQKLRRDFSSQQFFNIRVRNANCDLLLVLLLLSSVLFSFRSLGHFRVDNEVRTKTLRVIICTKIQAPSDLISCLRACVFVVQAMMCLAGLSVM